MPIILIKQSAKAPIPNEEPPAITIGLTLDLSFDWSLSSIVSSSFGCWAGSLGSSGVSSVLISDEVYVAV